MKLTLLILLTIINYSSVAQRPITVQKKGNGASVIFLPGFACPGSVWDEAIDRLESIYEVHQVTYAGFDGTLAIDTPWYSALKTALVDYVNKENLQSVYLVGHSMGGTLAVDIAATLPNNIKKILLVDALPCMRDVMMPGIPTSSITYNNPFNQQMIAMTEPEMENYATTMVAQMTNNEDKRNLISTWMMNAERKTFVYGYTDLLKLDLREDLKKILCPAVILSASSPGPDIFLQNYKKQYANLNNKEIKLAPESKHFIMFDQPEWFYNELNDFLKK